MRNEDSIAQQIRDIQLDIQELKARQYTGEDQVVVKEYTTDPITFSTSATSPTTYYKRCYVRVTADGLPVRRVAVYETPENCAVYEV